MRSKYAKLKITPEQFDEELARARANIFLRKIGMKPIERRYQPKPKVTGAALKTALKEWYGIDY